MENFTFFTKKGHEINDFATDFAKLRINVFKEFPYLYDGTLDYELDYLKTYATCPDAFMFAIYKQQQMIGATTCIPLIHETENVLEPFIQKGIQPSTVMYFGESLLLSEFRGLGFGHRFFDEREKYSKAFSAIQLTTFCAVDRPSNHPLIPANYRVNDPFWIKRGYEKQADMQCSMFWTDIDQPTETEKKLTFWTKK